MYPILFSIGNIHFYSYGLFAGLALIAGSLFVFYLAQKEKLPAADLPQKTLLVILLAFAVGHGSYFFFYPEQFNHWYQIFYLNQGLTSFGGLLGGLLGLILFFKKKIWLWLDIFAITFLLGVFFWRLGCFLTGDHPQVYSTAWFAIDDQVPVVLLESLLGLIGFASAFLVYKKNVCKNGILFYLAMGYYGLVRLVIDHWRLDSKAFYDFSWGQLAGLGLVIFSVIAIIVSRRKLGLSGQIKSGGHPGKGDYD